MEIPLRSVLQGNLSNEIFIAENYHEIIRKMKSNVNVQKFTIEISYNADEYFRNYKKMNQRGCND